MTPSEGVAPDRRDTGDTRERNGSINTRKVTNQLIDSTIRSMPPIQASREYQATLSSSIAHFTTRLAMR